jgi:hypothetical protein
VQALNRFAYEDKEDRAVRTGTLLVSTQLVLCSTSVGASLRVNLVAPPRERFWAKETGLSAPTYLHA